MNTEAKQEVLVSRKPAAELPEVTRPGMPMLGAVEEVERLFDRLMPRTWMSPLGWRWPLWAGLEEALESIRTPKMDVIDRDQDLLIHVEMPGVDKKDIDVSVINSTLQIRGTLHHESREARQSYYRSEIAQGNFARTLALPAGVESAKISASLKDGILEIVLPKEAHARRRSVEIK